ncbi:hypothetical protein [Enterococcus sp. CSURQ0835]|uniref:hypothetical protein n=1 Tax=Enterococcus sp. CSURQ0835 TaxID=2681394 RepID=UPI00190F2C43|nr:hypothetical protein [Enterococcus sp. CSURQ0835]
MGKTKSKVKKKKRRLKQKAELNGTAKKRKEGWDGAASKETEVELRRRDPSRDW